MDTKEAEAVLTEGAAAIRVRTARTASMAAEDKFMAAKQSLLDAEDAFDVLVEAREDAEEAAAAQKQQAEDTAYIEAILGLMTLEQVAKTLIGLAENSGYDLANLRKYLERLNGKVS